MCTTSPRPTTVQVCTATDLRCIAVCNILTKFINYYYIVLLLDPAPQLARKT